MRLLHSKLTMKQYTYVSKGGRVGKRGGGHRKKKPYIKHHLDVSVLVVKLHKVLFHKLKLYSVFYT